MTAEAAAGDTFHANQIKVNEILQILREKIELSCKAIK